MGCAWCPRRCTELPPARLRAGNAPCLNPGWPLCVFGCGPLDGPCTGFPCALPRHLAHDLRPAIENRRRRRQDVRAAATRPASSANGRTTWRHPGPSLSPYGDLEITHPRKRTEGEEGVVGDGVAGHRIHPLQADHREIESECWYPPYVSPENNQGVEILDPWNVPAGVGALPERFRPKCRNDKWIADVGNLHNLE